jgi:hypothetical protein
VAVPHVVEYGKCHVARVTLPTLHHFHINAERRRNLSGHQRVILFEAVDKYMERRDHSGTIVAMTSPSGESFSIGNITSVRLATPLYRRYPEKSGSDTDIVKLT